MLSSKERSKLRALGNELTPILTVGKSGITPAVIAQLDEALIARELVKGRVLPHNDLDVKDVAQELAAATNAELVQVIGRNILFYRQLPPEANS